MIGITYPIGSLRRKLHGAYHKVFDISAIDNELSKFFSKRKYTRLGPITAKALLTMEFQDLVKLSFKINKLMVGGEKGKLKKILNYDKRGKGFSPKMQPAVAEFFMNHCNEIGLSTCYFCNIEFVNSYNDIRDYHNPMDFARRANTVELASIEGISIKDARKILVHRVAHPQFRINSLPLTASQKNNLQYLRVDSKRSHFTLDHVLHKSAHPLSALSLYNFVPSCYTCNSKLKGSKALVEDATVADLSPTFPGNSFSKDVLFRLFFHLNPPTKFHDVKKLEDFVVDFHIKRNQDKNELLLDIFKIRSRYVFHKGQVLSMLQKRAKYSNAKIRDLANRTGSSMAQVKADLFGDEIYDVSLSRKPLTKLKRDIAYQIGII